MKGKEVQVYIQKYLEGDKTALEEVVPHIEGMIKSIITKYVVIFDYEDLYQVGWVGVMQSLETYNLDKGVLFVTYCYRGIEYAVKQYVQGENRIYNTKEDNAFRRQLFSLDNMMEIEDRLNGLDNLNYYAVTAADHDTEKEAVMHIMTDQALDIIQEFSSDTQRQILYYHMEGKQGRWIAEQLNVSQGYVSTTIKKFNRLCNITINK